MKIFHIEKYSQFASVYDSVMEHIDYKSWAQFILDEYFHQRNELPTKILDVACGSGQLLKRLNQIQKASYYGLDISPEMVAVARENNKKHITIKVGSMAKLPFSDNFFNLITSTHDSLNYLIPKEDLMEHFKEIHRTLYTDGLYFVDITSEENILRFFHNKTKKVKIKAIRLKWSNQYNFRTRIIESILEFTNKKLNESYIESHYQKYYPADEIIRVAEKFHLQFLDKYSDYQRTFKKKRTNLIILVFKKK